MRNVHSRIYAQSLESHPAPTMNSAPLLPLPISVPSSHPASLSREESQQSSILTSRAASQTCCYAGKECSNLRIFKRNGSLHSLCHFHRVRANQNQRRMELRRRIARVKEEGLMQPPVQYALSGATGDFSAGVAQTRAQEPTATSWRHLGGMPLVHDMLPLPSYDELRELFSAPGYGNYAAHLPYTTIQPPTMQEFVGFVCYPALPTPKDHLRGVFPSVHPSAKY